jgi:exodeoxyribonuclease III
MSKLYHFVNWNVNGIRSIIKKDFIKDVEQMNPDVLCLQETKAAPEDDQPNQSHRFPGL